MKSSTVSRPARRTLPMPLWMQGGLELLLAAVSSYLLIVLMLVAIWYTNGFNNRDFQGVASLSGNIWLLTHSVPLHLDMAHQGTIAAISGTMAYTPLGLTLIPLLLCFHSGRKLARASYEGQFWVPLLGGLVTYVLFSAGLSYISSTPRASTDLLSAAFIPCWVAAVGVIGGGLYESRSLSGMIGVNAADNVRKYSQYSRWAGSYVWTLVRASFVAPLALLAGGALLAGLSIFYNWNDILAMYQALHAGAVGDTAITFLQLGIVPNLMVYAMSYSTGAGFALGSGSSIDWSGANVGALPLLPLLGAIPTATEPFSYISVAVPVLAGVLAGWWFFREGEDHLDEWLSLKIRFRPVSWVLSHLFLAVVMGAISGIWVALLGWVAHGSLGLGKFIDIGPNPLIFGALAAAWFALGIFLGSLLGRLVEKDAKVELTRESDDVVLVRAEPEEPAQKKRFGFGKKKAKKAEKTAEEDESSQVEETAAEESSDDKPRVRSTSAGSLKAILSDDEPDAAAEEPEAQPVEEVPWWEKNTRKSAVESEENAEESPEPSEEAASVRADSDTDGAEESETKATEAATTAGGDTDSAEEAEETAQPIKPKLRTPRLSRGTVIRRPKAQKKTDDD